MIERTLTESENFQRMSYAVGYLYLGVTYEVKPGDIFKVIARVCASEGYIQFKDDSTRRDAFRKYFLPGKLPPKNEVSGEVVLKGIQFACAKKGLKQPSKFDTPLDELNFPSNIVEAVRETFEARQKVPKLEGVPFAVDVDIDPLDIDGQVRNRTSGELKAHLLYQSPIAAALWDKVKTSPFYPLHNSCAMGLRNILQQEPWRERREDLRLILSLGAGSWTKDKMILQQLKPPSNTDIVFIWIDASFEMLRRTIKESRRSEFQDVSFAAMKADFEHPQKLRRLYKEHFQGLPRFEEKKAFFILGFTLSNLNETRFFAEYSAQCSIGDLFIFPMQFIPEGNEETLTTFENNLLQSYEFDEGTALSRAGLAFLQRYEIGRFHNAKIDLFAFHKSARSRGVKFAVDLVHKGDATVTKVITAQSNRHYEADYLQFLADYGFKVIDRSREHDGVQTLLVEYVGEAQPMLGGTS
ncbi:MAG: L-histidine N(alpha)-methyltransferase [Candidatus Accumulibacter sp.]|nr:L-histidine N(alpha)-methyltransferase [Candidatus Accumulibacter conexus]